MSRNVMIALAAAAVLAAGTVYFLKDRADREAAREQQKAYQEQLMSWEKKALELKDKVKALEQEVQAQDPAVNEAKMTEVFGEESEEAGDGTPAIGEESPLVRVQKIFSYIDERGYLQARGVSDNASVFFEKLIGKLQRQRPVVAEETRDMYTLLKNITYFFRVLGKTDVLVIKDMLRNESEIVEPTMAVLYSWLDPWGPDGRSGGPGISPELAYEYAGFLLQTIAGQAYIFRRDSRVRSLTTYYCILILDNANLHGLNHNGIDIRPHIDTLIQELESHRMLADRRKYLEVLKNIRKKY